MLKKFSGRSPLILATRSTCSTFLVLAMVALCLLPPAAPALALGHQVRFDQLNVENGLAQISGLAVVQDHKGFIWVGTQEGLHRYDGYKVVHYTHDPDNPASLAGDFILALYPDRQGNLWISSQPNLLTRLDLATLTFRRFIHDPADPTTLAPGGAQAVYEDSEGFLWLAMAGSGIDKIAADGTVTHIEPNPSDPEGLPSANITAFFEDSRGILWIGTRDSGLVRRLPSIPSITPGQRMDGEERFSTYRHNPKDDHSLGNDLVSAIYEDRRGRLYIGTQGGGIYELDPQSEHFRRLPHPAAANGATAAANLIPRSPTPHQSSILEDRAGRLWAQTNAAGLLRWNAQRTEVDHLLAEPDDSTSLPTNTVTGMLLDSVGDLWFGTTRGLAWYDPQSDGFITHRRDPADPQSLGGNLVFNLLEDRSGILWIGTSNGGVSRMSRDKHQFKSHRRPTTAAAGEDDNMIFSVLLTRDGTLWCGTFESGVYRFDASRRHVIERYFADPGNPRDIGSNSVRFVHEDSRGWIWLGTQDPQGSGAGLVQVDPERGEIVRRWRPEADNESSLISNQIIGIDEDSRGMLWISAIGGWHRLDLESGEIRRYVNDPDDPNSLISPTVRLTFEDRSGQLWVGAFGGFGRFNADTETFTNYRPDPEDSRGLTNGNIMALQDDDQGRMYVATYGGGLQRLDLATGEFRHFGIRDGLPGASLYSVLPDDQGQLWISTNQGLSRFDPSSETFTNFDRDDGLAANEFNGRSYFKADSGEMFFGGTRGITSFFPSDIKPRTFQPPVVLTAFRKADKEVRYKAALDEMERVVLSYKDRFFGFEFAALDYDTPRKNRYAYKLEGFDEDWVESGSRRYATYTNLDGDTYTFKVKGSNSDGTWSDDVASIEVVVVPPPWKTWWAYSLYFLTLVAAATGYMRFKTLRHEAELRLQREELERERLVADRLRQIDAMKDEFLANTSHELRTPLNGIIGIAESLIDGATGELGKTTRSNLFMVASSGRRLAHLVDDILDFSKLKNREIELRQRAVSLREVVEIVLTLSRPLTAGRDLLLENRLPEDLPRVLADENRLQQVLHNLVGNAIKFTEHGAVTIDAQVEGNQVVATVSDTGVGIEAAKLETIFQSFEQADASSAREFGGTGLGLTITRQLIELHGGEIQAESEPGQGTRLTFSLPLATTNEEVDPAPSARLSSIRQRTRGEAATEDGSSIRLAKDSASDSGALKILIVDDEPINLQVLENILTLEHYGVTRAQDGPQALELLDGGYAPDLVLLDVMMPRMTGFEVARRIRRKHSANNLPIILVTAKNQVSDLMEGLASGANDYITKPFSKDELLARIRTHASLSKAHGEEAENRRKTRELEQARSIQLSMLPAEPPDVSFLDIAVHMQTATEVGGDYYDFFPQSDDSLYVATGDATGHGISAGMMVSMTKSALRALDVQSPHVLLAELNRVFREVHLKRMKMALNVAYITPTEVALASAAMPPVFFYQAASKEVSEILVSGLPLGSLADLSFRLEVFDFRPGDVLVMISDGLPESINDEGEQLGYEPLGRCLAKHAADPVEEIRRALVNLGTEWAGQDIDPDDDITVLVLKHS